MKKINSLKVLKKNRYLIACIFTLVMIICGGLLIGKNLHEFSQIEVKNTAKITATVVADYIKNGLAETNQIAEELGNSRHIINILGPESYKYLNDANETLDRYSLRESLACYVINLEGLTIASSNRNSSKSFVNKNYGFRPYFKEAVKGKKASYFALEVTSGERGYYSSVPVKDSTGKVIGAAVVKKTLDIDEQYLKKFEEYFFVNEDGIIFLSSDPKYLFQSFYPLDEKQLERIKASKQFGDGPFNALFKTPTKKEDSLILDSKDMLVFTVPVGDYGWRVIILKPCRQMLLYYLFIIIPVAILSLTTIRFFYYLLQKDKLVQDLKRSKQRYTSIFETGPQVTIIFDLNAKIIACSRRITEILGYTVAEIVNKSGFSFASESDQEKAKQLLGEVLQKKEMKGFLLKIRHKNKTIRDISFNVSLMPGESEEKQASIVCVIEDVTERLADVENLKESKNQYQKVAQEYALTQEATLNILEDLQESKNAVEADRRGFLNIIENIRDGIVIVDEDGIVKFANKSAQDICDTELIEMIEKPFAYVINMNEVGKVKINHRNGRTALVELRVSKTEWMQQTMSLVVLHDITQQEEAKNLLLRAAEEWRCTFDAIGDGVSLLNVEGKVIRCNNAAARIFNKPFPDVIGTDCHDFSHAGQKAPDCVINRAIQLGERSTEICKKDEKWYLFSADPLISKGKVTGVVHTMSDITEQKNTENKMREYAEYIENIVETAQSLIIVLDKELRIKSINRFAEDLFGYKRKDIIGSEWIDLVTPSDYKDESRQVLMTCLEGDRVIGYEIPVIARDEKEIMISWYSAELLDADGKIVGIVTMGYDISQRKEIEKVQRLAQLGTLVSHMAHEVNNPLMVISGRAQLALMEDIQNQEVKDNLEVVINECKRAKDIIQRLLRFSRPSKGEIHEVDINKSLEEVVGLLEHQFGLENIAILTDIAPNLPSIKGDEKQLIEVFMNLLTNAHDAIEGEGSIRIEVKEKKGFVKITFKDTGMGMSKQVMDKIFDPFFTTKKKGTGLGLSICYSIIKAHNGDLKFESIEGRGTTAVILLPVLKPSYDEESAGMS